MARARSSSLSMYSFLSSYMAQKLNPDLAMASQPPSAGAKSRRLHPTSYLDGLRGIASVLVFFCHYTEENHRYMLPTYGLPYENDGVASSPVQLPFFRLIFSGRPMVHIFFVISGFALSYKPLKEIRARNFKGFHAALSSSAFRRPIRLYGPPLVSTCIVFLMVCLGLVYKPQPTFRDQLEHWASSIFYQVLWPWSWDTELRPRYDLHLWTIPIEMCHSMLLFVILLTLSRVRYHVRLFVTLFLMNYCLSCGRWAAFEFIAGMLLAEFHLKTAEERQAQQQQLKLYEQYDPADGGDGDDDKMSIFEKALHWAILLTAFYISGWPNNQPDYATGISVLDAWTPAAFPHNDPTTPQKFWFALCAVGVVWSCGRLSLTRKALESRFAQYCGRVSYAVYIVHGPVLELLQTKIMGEPPHLKATSLGQGKGHGDGQGPSPAPTPIPGQAPGHLVHSPGHPAYNMPATTVAGFGLKGLTGVETVGQRTLCWLLGLVFFVPLVMAVSDIFCRWVDEPIVDMARRIERRCAIDELERTPTNPVVDKTDRDRWHA
ncbi:acyltransferase 3 [Apiospora arundinis]|uniref:Acyltransferase 3 n=1 Tax=Apiospora arundinis TaxID=335852 RepID=A0ABR2I306_9PEZI